MINFNTANKKIFIFYFIKDSSFLINLKIIFLNLKKNILLLL